MDPHCLLCHPINKLLDNCPPPGSSIILYFFSLLPYPLALLSLGKACVVKSLKSAYYFAVMLTGYLIVRQPRPIGACHTSYGYPSSHTSVIFAFATAFFFNNQWPLGLAVIFMAGCAGWGRVQMNYHSWSQVLAGGVLGVLTGLGWSVVYRLWSKKQKQ